MVLGIIATSSRYPEHIGGIVQPPDVLPSVLDEDENGRFVPVEDPRAMAGALLELMADQPLRIRMSAANRKKAEVRFDLSVAVRNLAALFREAVEA